MERLPLLRLQRQNSNGQHSPSISITQTLTDQNLLGAALGDAGSWSTWLTVLKAAFGQELSAQELAIFASVAGDRPVPRQRVRELWAIVVRRAGKSRIAAAIAVFIACFIKPHLARGEVGHCLVLAASRDQAATVFSYTLGFLDASPILRQ